MLFVLGLLGQCAEAAAQAEPADSKPRREGPTSPTAVFIYPVIGTLDDSNCERIHDDLALLIDQHGFRNFLLEIDSPGGDLAAVRELAIYIDSLSKQSITTIAYIPTGKSAFSGGTLLAFACKHLEMGENSRIGDVALVDSVWHQPLPEKIQSFVRADLLRYARERFPKRLVEAMVSQGPRVYRAQLRTATGTETQYLTDEELEKEAARVINREVVIDAGRLLVLDEKAAKLNDFIQYVFPTREQLLEHHSLLGGDYHLDDFRLRGTFSGSMENWTRWFLGNDWVRFALILLGVLGVVFEIKFPGTTLPGAVGLGCFILFFVGAFLGGTAGWVELAVFAAGLVLLAVEIFLLPGFGVAGFSGLILLLGSLVMALVGSGTGDAPLTGVMSALAIVLGGFAMSVILTLTILHFLPQSASVGQSGLIARAILSADPGPTRLLSRKGKVVSPLRPAGKIDVDGEIIDATSSGEFLDNGIAVEVIDVKGNRVVVRSAGGTSQ
ncbi:MAG: hypothetical protein L0Z55_03720 [Planctomycetes bacterium]|nr:hypothetical protein [Planctomycetota bacterium]